MRIRSQRLLFGLLLLATVGFAPTAFAASVNTSTKHIATKDYSLIDDAFLHGYTHNLVNEKVGDKKLITFTVGCIWDDKHSFW